MAISLINAASQGGVPAFSAYQNSAQSFSSGTFTKATINTKIFDTASAYDNTTNYRFTPLVAGYYQVSGSLAFGGSATGWGVAAIYKNGSIYAQGVACPHNTNTGAFSTTTDLVYLNGSTDYIELWGVSAGATISTQGNQQGCYFSAVLVRSA